MRPDDLIWSIDSAQVWGEWLFVIGLIGLVSSPASLLVGWIVKKRKLVLGGCLFMLAIGLIDLALGACAYGLNLREATLESAGLDHAAVVMSAARSEGHTVFVMGMGFAMAPFLSAALLLPFCRARPVEHPVRKALGLAALVFVVWGGAIWSQAARIVPLDKAASEELKAERARIRKANERSTAEPSGPTPGLGAPGTGVGPGGQ
jgi:hypothetical protein